MGHIPASRRTVTMAIAVIAVITLSIAMLCGCGTARNTNQATDSGSGGNRLASSLQAYATQLLGQDSGMDPAQKATLRKAATSGKISLSDYKAAWSRYITCVQDKGYPRPTLKTYSNGIQQPPSSPDTVMSADVTPGAALSFRHEPSKIPPNTQIRSMDSWDRTSSIAAPKPK